MYITRTPTPRERRQILGRTAQHWILRERQVAEPGACSGNFETETDGWYVPRGNPTQIHSQYRLAAMAGGTQCRDTVIKHGAPSDPGMALLETTTRQDSSSDGVAVSSFSTTKEVLEFSTEPLDSSLFDIPADFKKVDSLPGTHSVSWSDYLAYGWAELRRAVESWFD